MEYTLEQEQAIHHHGENILVSAGAGSGKTAVLTQRVFEKIKNGVAIDDLIILTFTNAAAAEMKNRIKKRILKDSSLSHQLARLDNAVISTFDSFALRLVKQYHFLLGIGEDLRIVDQAILRKTKETILDQVMNRRYQAKDPRFLSVVDRLFDKGDRGYRDAVITLAAGTEMIPNRMEFLQTYQSHFFGSENIDTLRKAYRARLSRQLGLLKKALHSMKEMLGGCRDEKILLLQSNLTGLLSPLLATDEVDEWIRRIPEISLPSAPRLGAETQEVWGETLKAAYDPLRDQWKKIREDLAKLFVGNMSDAVAAVQETQDTILEIVSATREYLLALEDRKKRENMFDFGDVMAMAIGLLEGHREIAEGFRGRIHEILVDEYQDTNDLQDYFLSLLENDNLFMVGDVKQSIYGFRNANPQNFVRKFHEFDEKKTGKTIDLLANFRSRPEVLSGINRFFENLMDEGVGGVDYKNRQALVYGNKAFDKWRRAEEDYQPTVLNYSISDEDSPAMSKAYREGAIIASDIRSRIDRGFRVFDPGLESDRPAGYQDFAILVDRKSGFEEYQKALVDAGFPVLALTDEKFMAASEILFVNNALRLVKCFRDSAYFQSDFAIAFFGVARSFAYAVPDAKIVDILQGGIQDSVAIRTRLAQDPVFSDLSAVFEDLAAHCDAIPLVDTLMNLYQKAELFSKIARLPDPENVERKLLFLVEKAKELPEFTLEDLIGYFDDLYRADDLDIEYARPYDPSVNAIRLMSIHKSKGLEFPVCYYPGLYKRFNNSESKAFFIFDKRYGLITKAWDGGFKETILHQLNRDGSIRERISERIRLFYVAMTRAKEKIVLIRNEATGKTGGLSTNAQGYLDESVRLRFTSYADFLAAIPAVDGWNIPAPLLTGSPTVPHSEPPSARAPIRYEEREYPAQKRASVVFSKSLPELRDPATKVAIEYGTRLHAELERFDYRNWESALSHVSGPVAKALSEWVHTPPFADRAHAIFHPEYEFREETNDGIRQGVIDLMVEHPDHIDIIDFKLKNLDDDGYIRQLNGYRDFIARVTKKPVQTYLFSILEGNWTLVEESK